MIDLQGILKRRMSSILKPNALNSSKKRKVPKLIWILLVGTICIAAIVGAFHYRLKKIERRQKANRQSVKILEQKASSPYHLGNLSIPTKLSGIPFGEDLGIVLKVKEIKIRNVNAPYNPGLTQSTSGYDLFFRYDLFNPKIFYTAFSSQIGVVSLDHEFEQREQEFKRIDLKTEYAEDPRTLFVGNQLYLFCNSLFEKNPKCRFMCVAELDPNSYEVKYKTILDINFQWIEKNWSPFTYVGEDQKPRLLLEYRFNPRKLLELPNPKVNELKNVFLPPDEAYLALPWVSKWGEIRGGTPLIQIGDEYLGFFHSWFKDENKVVWYVMGAYTCESHPPFNMTRISKYPLFFKGIYETPFINTASTTKRVIFPSGIAFEKKDDHEWIYLACGENDCAIKVVTLDKENLIKSMLRLKNKE